MNMAAKTNDAAWIPNDFFLSFFLSFFCFFSFFLFVKIHKNGAISNIYYSLHMCE